MKKTKFPTKVQFVRRPSPRMLKVVLVLLLLFSGAALLALDWFLGAIRTETQKLAEEAADISYINGELEQRIHDPDSVENVKKAAEEVLGLVDPDTVIIDPN